MPRIWSEPRIVLNPGERTDILAPVDVSEFYVIADAAVAGVAVTVAVKVLESWVNVVVAAGGGPILSGGYPWMPVPAASGGCGQKAMIRLENQGPNSQPFALFWKR